MGLLSGGKVIVGYDLGDEFSQISYSLSDSGEVETLSQVAGAEIYNIPTALSKRCGTNQWFYGREALRCGAEEDGIQIDGLLSLARDGEPVLIDGESLDPVALLTLFVKRSLGMLSQVASFEKIGALTFTCEVLDHRMLEVLSQVVTGLRLRTEKVVFQSHMECYYNYMLYQPETLRLNQSVLFHWERDSIRVYRMECNRRTVPVVVLIEESGFPFPAQEDLKFLKVAEEVCEGRSVGSVFLIGDGFDQERMQESLRYLCNRRRVFQGNNLFSKGAVFGMQERLKENPAGKGYVFLSPDKLKANVGMEILRQGEKSYCALLDAGVNWYEAEAELEFYLQDGNEICLTITPLTGQNGKYAQIALEDAPEGLTRLKGRFYLEAENILGVEIEDEGLGEIRAATGKIWKETIELL